ncbi:MAG: hypothetical protein ACXIVG_05090 [Pararhodobacter sp.]
MHQITDTQKVGHSRDGRSIPLGDAPEICKYEELHEQPGPFYLDDDWTNETQKRGTG